MNTEEAFKFKMHVVVTGSINCCSWSLDALCIFFHMNIFHLHVFLFSKTVCMSSFSFIKLEKVRL